MAMEAAATTERASVAAAVSGRPTSRRHLGPDRLTVVLFTLAAFLTVLALLAWQMRSAGVHARPVTVVRRVYQTTVVETIIGPSGGGGGSAVTQSVSSSGSSSSGASGPTTRTS
jgi:uncharacterized membrane protein YgcG